MKTCVFGGGGGADSGASLDDTVGVGPIGGGGTGGRCSVVAPPLSFSPATEHSSSHHHGGHSSLYHLHQRRHHSREHPASHIPLTEAAKQGGKPSTASTVSPASMSPASRQQHNQTATKSTGIDTLSANSLLPPTNAGYRHVRRTSRVINNVSDEWPEFK